jgi:hypothetical protein
LRAQAPGLQLKGLFVSIHRPGRKIYGCWHLKVAFSQPFESQSNRNSKNDEKQNQNIFPEQSNFGCRPGGA